MTTVPTGPPTNGPVRFARLRSWSWIAVLVIGVASYLLVLRTLVATQNANFIPSLILLGSTVVPATVLVFAASGGRRLGVSPGVLAFVAIMGGVVGTVAAGTLEFDALQRLGALPMIFVGFFEESAKLIIPVLVLIFSRHRNPQAGVIIGVASGMGFATLETMGYGFTALLSSGSLREVQSTLLLRALLSPAGHVAWTGMTTAALWHLVGARRKGRALLAVIGTFLLAVLLHAAWDGFNSLIVHVVVGGFSFVALLVTIRRAHRVPAVSRGGGVVPQLT